MRKINLLFSSAAILPGLVMSPALDQPAAAANPQAFGMVQIAQAAPAQSEEEKRRKLEEEHRHSEQENKQHPAGGQPPPAPVHPVNPPSPVAQPNSVPHPAPNAPAPAPAPVHVAPPAPVAQPNTVQHAVPAAPTNNPPQPPAPNQGQFRPQSAPLAPIAGPQHGAPANQPVTATHGPSTMAPQFPAQQQPQQGNQPKGNGITPLQAGVMGAAAGIVGGMIIGHEVHGLGEVQSSRQTVQQNGATFYSEPGRVIVREGDGLYVRHDETERFREFGTDVRVEQHGDETIQMIDRPDHSKIITITDRNGQLLKRLRRLPNGAEIVLIDNTFRPRPQRYTDEIVVIDRPVIDLPPDRYDLDAGSADETQIYDTLIAPPVAHLPRRYTLDEVRYSHDLRQYVRSVDLTAITFDTGSWTVQDSEIGHLQGMADAINRAIRANPNQIFLIEGHTDAVGNDVDNLSLSDRRAQTVAAIMTRNFNVPPENLTTQGYGSQFLKIQTDGAERANRRVTVRNVTSLIASGTRR
jgi:outer membrane protein OmpA-like peptidoglycan-associated protein